METNPLVGKVVVEVLLSKDHQAINFKFADGTEMPVFCDADCCSHTWIEHLELPALGFPAQVVSVEDQGVVQRDDNSEEYDCLQYYITKIVTDKGELVIDYRNSSNGYYGGSLCWPGESYYGGVYGQNISKQEWEKVGG